jgi:hypothetical protein
MILERPTQFARPQQAADVIGAKRRSAGTVREHRFLHANIIL